MLKLGESDGYRSKVLKEHTKKIQSMGDEELIALLRKTYLAVKKK